MELQSHQLVQLSLSIRSSEISVISMPQDHKSQLLTVAKKFLS